MSEVSRPRSRMGPWRLVELFQASMPGRFGMLSGGGAMPEYGPPDVHAPLAEPDELPGSNIAEHERAQAVQRERWRRSLGARGARAREAGR